MNDAERERFDSLIEDALEAVPPHVRAVLEEVPLVVLDRPTPEILRSLGFEPGDEEAAGTLCGLHSGIANTERSLEHSGVIPNQIHLFREGIVALAGGWDALDAEDEIYEEIRTTLLHEIGHQMGLDEDDLEGLGYA